MAKACYTSEKVAPRCANIRGRGRHLYGGDDMPKDTCSIEGCSKGANARGWCSAHYSRWRRYGDPNHVNICPTCGEGFGQGLEGHRASCGRTCSIDGCGRGHLARGWCRVHYKRWKDHGDPQHEPDDPRGECSIEECDKPHKAGGLCAMHYQRYLRDGSPVGERSCAKCGRGGFGRGIGSHEATCGVSCSIDGCSEYGGRYRGLCERHNQRRRYEVHRDRHLHYSRRRRARKAGATLVPFTVDELDQRLSMFSGCWICGGPKESHDHVKPLAKGGAHCLANLRPACTSCNSRKNSMWPLDLEALRG